MALPQERSAKKQEMEYKRIEREMKNKELEIKQKEKMKKRFDKQHKRWEKLKKKYEKKGWPVPPEPKFEMEPEKPTPKTTPAKDINLPEAEIITAEADVWTPKSARNLDEIQKRIDRMDKKHIKNLRDRYKERYGEDLEVPDIYNVSSSIEVETAEESGELEKVESPTTESVSKGLFGQPRTEKTGLRFGRKERAEKVKVKTMGDRPIRFFDFRTPLFFLKKFSNEESGGGKKAILAIVDIIVIILLFPITILRILITPYYMRKDRKEAELNQELSDQSSSAQPT
jgi:hypothetical protein